MSETAKLSITLITTVASSNSSPPSTTHHSPPSTSQPTDNGSLLVDPAVGFDSVTAYSVDGTGNNQTNPDLGAAGTDETRLAPANFAPGTTNTPVDGPNPHDISNAIFANDQNANDPGGRSAYMYAFGQFVDHDIDLNMDQTTAADGSNVLSFTIPSEILHCRRQSDQHHARPGGPGKRQRDKLGNPVP